MRRTLALAVLIALGCGSAALAQTSPAPSVPPPPASDSPFTASTQATDLSGLNLRIEADEVTMTRLRDQELYQENLRLAAIRPALKFKNWRILPSLPSLPSIHAPHIHLPKI